MSRSFTLSVKVNPDSSQRMARWKGDFLKVNLRSVPREGRANEELVEYLEEIFDLEAGDVVLVSGHRSPRKTVELHNLDRNRLVSTIRSLEE